MAGIRAGEIVRFRKRLWRVDEVLGEELVATAIDGAGEPRRRFLASLEEPEPAALPTPDYAQLGQAASQDLLLRSYRLSMLHGSAPFLSLQRSSVIPVNYQLVPLVMALQQPTVRLLIADDVGLGKTVEAGLILSELLCRGQAKRVLIVTPANLREQWQEALGYFFHVDARILSGHTRREYERELPAGANPWQYFQRVIVSIDYAKEPETRLKILEQPWDLVLVDEAHNAAKPHQVAEDQTVDMERWQFVQELARRGRHLLLITATPHNGYTDSFASLIAMLGPGLVSGSAYQPSIKRALARHYVCQRSRRNVEAWFEAQGTASPFPRRDQTEDIIPIGREMKSVLTEVERQSNRLLEEAKRSAREYALTEWLVLHLQKRALSSPAALRASLENRLREIGRRLGEEGEAVRPDHDLMRATVFDLDTGERTDAEEAARRADRTVLGDPDALRAQRAALGTVLEQARAITTKKDSKLQRVLKKHLPELLAQSPRLIIFTRYKDTLDYLVREFNREVGKNTSILFLQGDLSEAARREVFHEFERASRAVLVATDVISEGINLQHACSQVIHYELPWNPNRLEQRNGRVDRFGQQAKLVRIRTLVMDETLDVAILHLLIKKAVRIRDDRGFCPPYFGDEVNLAHLIRSRAAELNLSTQLSLFAPSTDPLEEALHRRVFDPLADDAVQRVAEDSFYGATDISLPDIEARLQRSHQLIGSPQEIQRFVESALNRYRCQIRVEKDATLTIMLPEPRLQLPGVGAKLSKATFDPAAALADPDLTVLDIGHPLVRRLIEMVREDFFLAGADYGRTATIVTDDVSQVIVLYHYLVRFVVHTDPVSVVEELLTVAFPIYGGEACSPDEVAVLLRAQPKPRLPRPAETQPHFAAAQESPVHASALREAVERRQQGLLRERRELREKLEREGDPAIAKSLRGIDKLTVASQDLLTATLYLPR